jgi:hypothetical protein
VDTQNKLKPGTSPYLAATFAVAAVLILAGILKSYLGEEIKDTTFGIIWAVATVGQILFWLKTKNPGYFTFSIVAAAMSFSYITDYKGIYFIVPFIVLISTHFYFMASKQLKWRYREVLEKAALPVNEAEDGFTTRPLPAGKVSFTKEKFFKLGDFLSRNLIAYPIEYEGNYFLLIKNAAGIWFQNPDTARDTYIRFDEEGNVSVNISGIDYKKFREELTFDQLNISLAGMFIEFWDLFDRGKEKEIIKFLDSKINT